MCAFLSGQRQRRDAPTATFESHFTPLRVKRPDTAQQEAGQRERRVGTRETERKRWQRQVGRRREREGHDVGEDEHDGCWRGATHSVWPRGGGGRTQPVLKKAGSGGCMGGASELKRSARLIVGQLMFLPAIWFQFPELPHPRWSVAPPSAAVVQPSSANADEVLWKLQLPLTVQKA